MCWLCNASFGLAKLPECKEAREIEKKKHYLSYGILTEFEGWTGNRVGHGSQDYLIRTKWELNLWKMLALRLYVRTLMIIHFIVYGKGSSK